MNSLREGYLDLKKMFRIVGFKRQKFVLLLLSLKQKHPQKNRIYYRCEPLRTRCA